MCYLCFCSNVGGNNSFMLPVVSKYSVHNCIHYLISDNDNKLILLDCVFDILYFYIF
jgi:hypothetical protein